MLKKIRDNLPGIIFIAALAAVAFLVLAATVWSVLGTNENIDQATNRLTSFYMEELVGKREVVLRDSLNKDFEQLERVIALLKTKDMQEQDDLQDFLADAQTLYGAKRLALVDEDGMVYTANSVFSDASRYAFLLHDFTAPQVITSNLYGAQKQVVVAMPVDDVRLHGSRIAAFFMQLDMDDVAGGLTYGDANGAGNTFIGLYYKNGENLTTSRFGDIEPGQNLLSCIQAAEFSGDRSFDEIEHSFRGGEKGLVTVVSGGDTKYIYYMPVEGTDWMLTVMVLDNTISDQLRQTSGTLLRRNIAQVFITSVMTVAIALFVGLMYKRNNQMRRRQRELEIKAKNEKELRSAYNAVESSKKELEQQLNVIGGMSNAFFAVYAVNLRAMQFRPVKESKYVHQLLDGCTRIDEALARFLPVGVHSEDLGKMEAFTDVSTLAERLADTDSLVIEYHSTQPNMEWCRTSWIVASRDEDGQAERVLYVSENITGTVQERKEHERSLRLARDEAEKANNAKTAFLFNMSHDIRTPMNAILGYTDIGLNHAEDAARAADSFRKIKTAGAHLLSLINDILEMSRIESGKLELVEHEVDLRHAVNSINALGQALALPKSIDFQTVVGDIRSRYIFADELHINEVIINLISNAVKYTPEGGRVRYTVSQLDDDAEGRAVFRFEVADNGIGMSEEFQSRLFEAFSREASSTVSRTEGAGLGLSIVKNIVDIAGGTIRAESVLHEGSTFTVEIPFRVMGDAEIEKLCDENRQIEEIKSDAALEGRRVLLVEDNEINREIATMILEDAGLIIETAEDGAIAVRMLREKGWGSYDFVLMDIQMPVMNGYEATRAIRAMYPDAKLPIIALSANAFAEDKAAALEAGMNGHVAKPIDAGELFKMLARFI